MDSSICRPQLCTKAGSAWSCFTSRADQAQFLTRVGMVPSNLHFLSGGIQTVAGWWHGCSCHVKLLVDHHTREVG